MRTARIFGCPIVSSPQVCLGSLLALCLIASAPLRRGSRFGARLLRPRSQTEERVCSLVLSMAARDPGLMPKVGADSSGRAKRRP
jgi:hypothetical protein